MSSQLRMEDKNILDHYSDLPVGDVFARARKSYGLSLQEASQQTLIRMDVLAAIEAGDHEKLPSRVYTLGFLRNYANYLGLDADKMMYLFKIQVIGEDHDDNTANAKTRRKSRAPSVNLPVPVIGLLGGGMLLIAAAFIYTGYTMLNHWGSARHDAQAQKALSRHNVTALHNTLTNDLSVAGEGGMALASDFAKWQELPLPEHTDNQGRIGLVLPEEGRSAYGAAWHSDGVALKATRTVWIELSSSDGELLLNTVLRQGDVVQIAKDDMLSLETSYGEALDVYVGGKYAGYLKGKENEERQIVLSKQTVGNLINPASAAKMAEKD